MAISTFMVDAMNLKPWSRVCRGIDCARKDKCRRHLYHELAVLRNYDAGAFSNQCMLTKHNGNGTGSFIDNNSKQWEAQPDWWTE